MNMGFDSENANGNKNLSEITNGIYRNIYTRITEVNIRNETVKNAFVDFVSNIKVGEGFAVGDIIFGGESVLKQNTPKTNPSEIIYSFNGINDYLVNNKKILKNSFNNVFELIGCHNGLMLDIDALGGSFVSAQTKRFVVLPEKKAQKVINSAKSYGIELVKTGTVLAENKLVLTRGNEVIEEVEKDSFYNDKEQNSIVLDESCYNDFLDGYKAVCSYSSCVRVNDNNLLRIGLSGTLAQICARALGIFEAMITTKLIPVTMFFNPDTVCTVAVHRPTVVDGDYLYLLRVKTEPNGLPDKNHLAQLNYYLTEMKHKNIIKDVLPLKENIISVIKRLCGDNLEYMPLCGIPVGSFGVIVSVPRGFSVNGIKLGYFKGTL